IVELASRSSLDAVVAVDDQGVLAAALAAERLGLPHNPPDAVRATRDKAQMRRALERAGVPQPAFAIAGGPDEAAALAGGIGPPCVLKPVSLAASRGVIRADDPAEAAAAAVRIRAITDGPILVERYMPGVEVAVEGLLRAGRLEVLAVFDKPDPLEGPYFEETLYVTPSRLPPDRLARVAELTSDAAAALGLTEGPIHAELRLDGRQVGVLELAARSIGGLCGRALRFGLGVTLEQLILRHALGLPLTDLRPAFAASGVMMIPIPARGVLRMVEGVDEARLVPGVVGIEITVARGHEVVPLPEGDRYLGFLFAQGPSPGEVEAALRAAHEHLRVTIDPQPGGDQAALRPAQ
ncbi:MAG: ATP-grasp domain-containing protein, partial [Gaiellales bacterium]